MGLRIISLFMVLFIGTNAHTTKDGDDHYEHMLELITDLQSTVNHLQSTVINLEGVVCKQTTELEHMEEKQLEMEENLMKCEGMVEEQTSTIEAVHGELQELAANISTIECSCDSSPEIMTTPEPTITVEPTVAPTSPAHTTTEPTTAVPKTTATTTDEPTTIEPTTMEPTTAVPTTMEPTTTEPTTMEPKTTMEPTTMEPTTMEPTTAPTTAAPLLPTNVTSCQGVFEMGNTADGVYTITVNNSPLQVYCQDGGWTVIQKRYDGSLDYSRNFDQYAEGFGSVEAEHWIGLNHVHELTSTGSWTLRFDLTAFNGDTAWAEYDEFRIDPGTDFTLWFDRSSYRGTAGNSFDYHHARKFTTTDMDQDDWSSANCADGYDGGGWWFGSCMNSLTTGMPYGGEQAIWWGTWKGGEVLKAATIKIIPN